MDTIMEMTVDSYRTPIEPPISNGRYTYASHELCLVRVVSDNGLVGFGVGDGGVCLSAAPAMIRAPVESLRPAVVGQDVLRTERIGSDMWSPKLLGRRGFTTRVVSAIDVALWDLKAKTLRVSIADLLGRHHESLPA